MISISEQGEKLIKKLVDNTNDQSHKRHIGVLRLAGNFKNDGNLISQFEIIKEHKQYIEQKYNIRLKFIGSNDNNMTWDDEGSWKELDRHTPFIIVINQVSGRSTEWKCHPYLVWYHTLRTGDTPTATIIQDQERAVLYTSSYSDEIDIEIYGDLPAAQYSAGIISLEQYDSMSNRKINSRLNTKIKKKHVKVTYQIFQSWNDIPESLKKHRSINDHVKEEYRLKQHVVIDNKTYTIEKWDKVKHLEGFIMTNIRSSRDKFLNNKSNQKPIWFESDIMNEIAEGINEKSKTRINLIYANGETNPNNFKFIVRQFASSEEVEFLNTSMYNTIIA
jgi:hypothetical protein